MNVDVYKQEAVTFLYCLGQFTQEELKILAEEIKTLPDSPTLAQGKIKGIDKINEFTGSELHALKARIIRTLGLDPNSNSAGKSKGP